MMAHKALKPPIEPLSERSLRRVEDAVIDRLRWEQPQRIPPRQPRMALLVAALSLGLSALAVATATDLLSPPEPTHQARSADDIASRITPSPAPDGRPVRIGVTEFADEQPEDPPLITTGSEPTTYELGGSELTIAPRSRVKYRGNDTDGWVVVVEDGSVECEVAPRQGRPDFVVRAGTIEVRVVGTRFEVAYREAQASVSVDEGKVLVLDSGQQTVLRAGQTWPSATSSQTPSEQEESDGVASRRAVSSNSAREDYELAASLESSEPARALSIYRRLSNSRGPWAANALYAQARLLKEGGRDTEARKLFSRYLKLYPRGTNAADARRLLEQQPRQP